LRFCRVWSGSAAARAPARRTARGPAGRDFALRPAKLAPIESPKAPSVAASCKALQAPMNGIGACRPCSSRSIRPCISTILLEQGAPHSLASLKSAGLTRRANAVILSCNFIKAITRNKYPFGLWGHERECAASLKGARAAHWANTSFSFALNGLTPK
jgi:hypothetical protein